MENPPRPPTPSGNKEEAQTTPKTPVLVTSDGHLVFPLPLIQGLDAHTPPTTVSMSSATPAPIANPPPRPTTPRRPTPRRPAPQPPTRPAPSITPIPHTPPISTPTSDRSLSTTPVPEPEMVIAPTPMPQLPITPAGGGVGVARLSLRLIDDETDTDEDSRCDSFEDRFVFTPKTAHYTPENARSVLQTAHTTPKATHPSLETRHPSLETGDSPLETKYPSIQPARITLTRPSPLAPTLTPVYARPPPGRVWDQGTGTHRGLAHSASDPGVRRAPMWHPAEAPLEEVREGATGGPRLVRSDSAVTVPEDLLAPRPSLAGVAAAALVGAALMPGTAMLLHQAFRLVFGTLFPAYYSYKAVKTKNVKEYVKWMMYWIVFAFFTCLETLTDIFLSFWFPFYYELKILVVLWLLSPATRGSSILYRKFVHPWLTRREEDIDNCIAQAKQQGYSAVLSLGSKGVNYATTVIMQTAIKGGGGLMNQLKRSYSSGELMGDDGDLNRNIKPLPPHLQDQGYDDPHHRGPPPGTPPTPHFTPMSPGSPTAHHYPPHTAHTDPNPYFTSASVMSPHFTPPASILAPGDVDGPPSPPLTRQRLRQQQQRQEQQRQRRRWSEEEVLVEEREGDIVGY